MPSTSAMSADALDDVFRRLDVTDQGLTTAEASTRLEHYGPNALPEPGYPSVVRVFLRQFLSPLIYILLAAGLMSLLLGNIDDAAFIAVVLLINGVIGTMQEYSAGKAAAALRTLAQPNAVVIRDGREYEIDARNLVPGDSVRLVSGDRVPADILLSQSRDLKCDESLLTGESEPVAKSIRDKVFAGTMLVRGRGRGVVSETGLATKIGQIAAEIGKRSVSMPPLLIRMEHFARMIALAMAVALVLLVGFGLLQEMLIRDLFMMSVGLAVSAIPEGLPVAISVALAIGMRRMAGENVIVRRMAAVESLGSCTMIATDKTGTLTLNELVVRTSACPAAAI